jgi:Acetoacetate decarboxylase (ADC)
MTNNADDVPAVAYPPAPWRSRGQLTAVILTTSKPIAIPPDLRPLGNPRRVVVALARYQQGTLCYSEFTMGSLVRRRHRLGMWVHAAWVDDLAALWGGRQIWALPKQLANFDWTQDSVRIHDDYGLIATLTIHSRRWAAPRIPFPVAGFSGNDHERIFTLARMLGAPRPARVDIAEWSDRLPTLDQTLSPTAITIRPLRLVVPIPNTLNRAT